jgi:hypothetical protein
MGLQLTKSLLSSIIISEHQDSDSYVHCAWVKLPEIKTAVFSKLMS